MLGHTWAVDLLREHVARGETRHAYLFSGPSGVGRRTLALRLAQALNCLQPPAPGEPCLECRPCSQLEKMQHPDLAVVQAEQVGGVLKVEQVRELQRSLSLYPYEARFRFALLLRFEEANPSAMNALLKTLEEPAPRVILALTAESPESLLPTIISRCEILRLRPLPLEQVSQALQERYAASPEQARLLAHISAGRIGLAARLQQTPDQLERRQTWLDEHTRLLSAGRVERFAYAEALTKDKDKDAMRNVLQTWLSIWRDVLLTASGATAPVTNLDRNDEIEQLAGRYGSQPAFRSAEAVVRTLDLLDANVNPRLAFEVLMLELPGR